MPNDPHHSRFVTVEGHTGSLVIDTHANPPETMNTYRRFWLSDTPRRKTLIARDLGSPTSYNIKADSEKERKAKARDKIDEFYNE